MVADETMPTLSHALSPHCRKQSIEKTNQLKHYRIQVAALSETCAPHEMKTRKAHGVAIYLDQTDTK
ncbi:unnamed protein product, partial [Rotaria magnacalcarata]